MQVLERINALSDEFRARAVQSATARYSREARSLTDSQLEVRYQQLVVSHRRMQRELNEAMANASARVSARTQLTVREMQAQKEAFEQERLARSTVQQVAMA